jgi:hypothetical protein
MDCGYGLFGVSMKGDPVIPPVRFALRASLRPSMLLGAERSLLIADADSWGTVTAPLPLVRWDLSEEKKYSPRRGINTSVASSPLKRRKRLADLMRYRCAPWLT